MATDKKYAQLRQAFQSIAGIAALESTDEFFFLHSLNRAAFKAWSESEIWPRYLIRNEERAIVPYTAQGETRTVSAFDATDNEIDFASDHGYSTDDTVILATTGALPTGLTAGTTYYVIDVDDDVISLSATAGGSEINFSFGESGTAYVIEQVTVGSVVPLTEYNKDTIAEFHRIFTADPFTSSSTAREVEFIVDDNGARIINPSSIGGSVFVDYKKAWDGPYTESSTTIPEEFTDYIINSILADFYSGDGQMENSLVAERKAKSYLELQLARLSWTNRNPYKYGSYMTHTNHQRRY